jgi:hypothetical protein
MIRCVAAVVSTFALACGGLTAAVSATATPLTEEASCVYTLSRPQVVAVSSALMVRATLSPFPCTGSINPNYLSVCLSVQGASSAGKCGFTALPSYAEVFVPYKPGTTYVTSGTGCGTVFTPQPPICSTVGPVSTTL